jgi:hypothetical protein
MLELLAFYEGRKLAHALRQSPCVEPSDSPVRISLPHIVLGKTKIGDVYGGRLLLTAYVQTAHHRAFVSDDAAERADAQRKLRAVAGPDGSWQISHGGRPLQLVVRPLSELPMTDEIKDDDSGVLKGWRCTAIKGDICVNIYNTDTGKFVYSMKTPKDGMNVCRPFEDETCAYKVETLKYKVYKEKDCKGDPEERELHLTTCQPA